MSLKSQSADRAIKPPKSERADPGAAKSALRLQPRDVELLRDLFLFGIMLRGQIERRYFGSTGRCNARLLKLYNGGFVRRLTLPLPTGASAAGSPYAYALGPAGIPVVATELGWEPTAVRSKLRHGTPTHISHTVEIVEFWLNLESSVAAQQELVLVDFMPEMLVRHAYEYQFAGSWRQEVFKPDAYFALCSSANDKTLHFFVEIDLGHTSSHEFALKLRIHDRYQRSGLFARTFAESDPISGFQTLYLTTSSERRDNLAEIAKKEPSARCLLATLEDARDLGMLSAIWHSPYADRPESLGDCSGSPQ